MARVQVPIAKVALITGGGQGIGKGIARRLLADGWRVAIAEIDSEAACETAREYGALGEIIAVLCDVSEEAAVREALRQALSAFGRLDALVNNAGISRSYSGKLERLERGDWDRVLAVNLTGPLLMAKHAAAHLRKTSGAIVNIASTRALQSEAGSEAYAASKGGLVALTHALALSLGPRVRVNCISPGWIEVSGWKKRSGRRPAALTPADHAQHPAGRVGTPEDIAALAAWLLSESAGFVTGQNFIVDGGMTKKMIYKE